MTEQDDFNEQWNARARSYNPPPPVPRDEMWARIQAARTVEVTPLPVRGAPRPSRHAAWWVTGIAAAAVLGAVLGRYTAPDSQRDTLVARGGTQPESTLVTDVSPLLPQATPNAEDVRQVPAEPRRTVAPPAQRRSSERSAPERETSAREPGRAYRVAAAEHLAMTEALLVTMRADLRSGRQDSTVGKWATSLLGTTRLMMDSPANQDPQLRRLFEDLELVLAQIARLSTTNTDTTELRIIDDAVRRRQVLTRLRAMSPGA